MIVNFVSEKISQLQFHKEKYYEENDLVFEEDFESYTLQFNLILEATK